MCKVENFNLEYVAGVCSGDTGQVQLDNGPVTNQGFLQC